MPFVAQDGNGNRVDITRYDDPRRQLKATDCYCQLCNERMFVVAGTVRRAHFRHAVDCSNPQAYSYHPQTLEHLEAKYFIKEQANRFMKHYSDVTFELEVRIPEIRRIADVLATFPNGWRVAHEIQLASITINELEERTNDYYRAGIDVIWWLGKSANNYTNRRWCLGIFGEVYTLDFDYDNEHQYRLATSVSTSYMSNGHAPGERTVSAR